MFNVLFVSFYVNFPHPTHWYEFVYVRTHLHRSNKDSWGIAHCFMMTCIDFLLKLWPTQLFELKKRQGGLTRFTEIGQNIFVKSSIFSVLTLLWSIENDTNVSIIFIPNSIMSCWRPRTSCYCINIRYTETIRTMILSWHLLSTPCSVIKFSIVESHLELIFSHEWRFSNFHNAFNMKQFAN